MATREQNIARLKELAELLGREPDIKGTAAEIAYRVAEWEEEAAVMMDTETVGDKKNGDAGSGESAPEHGDNQQDDEDGLVRVRMLHTVHLCARAEQGDGVVSLAVKGSVVRIPVEKLQALIAANLVECV